MERTGWWFTIAEMFLNLIHHPVCAKAEASQRFLDRAATPPGPGGAMTLVEFQNYRTYGKFTDYPNRPDGRHPENLAAED
jgi:hypothetical protein